MARSWVFFTAILLILVSPLLADTAEPVGTTLDVSIGPESDLSSIVSQLPTLVGSLTGGGAASSPDIGALLGSLMGGAQGSTLPTVDRSMLQSLGGGSLGGVMSSLTGGGGSADIAGLLSSALGASGGSTDIAGLLSSVLGGAGGTEISPQSLGALKDLPSGSDAELSGLLKSIDLKSLAGLGDITKELTGQ